MNSDLKFISIIGPTASGKSSLAMQLASKLKAEIVSCDSVQLYKGFDIGSAKASKQDCSLVVHHMLDELESHQEYDASAFAKKARSCIREINSRGILAIVVGGGGLYYRSLLGENMDSFPSNPVLRLKLKQKSAAELYRELLKVDQERACEIHPNDHYRLARALEIITLTKKPFSEMRGHSTKKYKPIISVLLAPERSSLHQKIAKRTENMLQDGFVQEVKNLIAKGCQKNCKPMSSIGYKQVYEHLMGNISLAELKNKIIFATRQYAKRQVTWFKKVETDWVIDEKEESYTKFWDFINNKFLEEKVFD